MKKVYSNEEIARKYYAITVTERGLIEEEPEQLKNEKIQELAEVLSIIRGKEIEMSEQELIDYINQLEKELENSELSKEEEKILENMEKNFPENIKTLRI